jgi:hypothetical protein
MLHAVMVKSLNTALKVISMQETSFKHTRRSFLQKWRAVFQIRELLRNAGAERNQQRTAVLFTVSDALHNYVGVSRPCC